MTLDELSDFTLDELGDFTLDELSLPIDEFIEYIKEKNIPIPVDMYERFLSIAGKLHIDTAIGSKSNLTVSDKLAVITIIVQIVLALLSNTEHPEINNTYNILNNTYIQIQNSEEMSSEDVDNICDQVLEALNDYEQ